MPAFSMPTRQTAVSTTAKTMWTVGAVTGATTLRRAKIFEFEVGVHATPTDNSMRVQIGRTTAAGTSTAGAATNLDSDTAVASLMTIGINHTAEPTYTTANGLMDLPFNQRATYRWVAAPGREFVNPATNAAGIGMSILSPTFSGDGAYGSVMWEE